MIQRFKNWLHRELSAAIADLSRDLDALKAELEASKATVAALVRDDAQIDAMRRVARATEYLAAAERHSRESRMQKSEF